MIRALYSTIRGTKSYPKSIPSIAVRAGIFKKGGSINRGLPQCNQGHPSPDRTVSSPTLSFGLRTLSAPTPDVPEVCNHTKSTLNLQRSRPVCHDMGLWLQPGSALRAVRVAFTDWRSLRDKQYAAQNWGDQSRANIKARRDDT